MSKYDEFDLDLTNIKIGDSTAGFTDTPTDRTCPEDTCNCPTFPCATDGCTKDCGSVGVCINNYL